MVNTILKSLRSVYTNVRLIGITCLRYIISMREADFCLVLREPEVVVSLFLLLKGKNDEIKCVCLEGLAIYCNKSNDSLEDFFENYQIGEVLKDGV